MRLENLKIGHVMIDSILLVYWETRKGHAKFVSMFCVKICLKNGQKIYFFIEKLSDEAKRAFLVFYMNLGSEFFSKMSPLWVILCVESIANIPEALKLFTDPS